MTIMGAGRVSAELPSWRAAVLLAATGVVATLTETRVPTIIGRVVPLMDAAHLTLGLVVIGLALEVANRPWRLPWQRPSVAIALAFFGCLAAGWLGGVSWPNSGDEYSYVFLADTLRAGRLWNTAPPDPELFRSFHVLVKDGRTFSPYPLAWSALLVPFRALGAVWLANPLLTVLLGTALIGACRRLELTPIVQKPALALVLLTPFTLFLGGSVFPQTMACALVACIVWAQLRDEAHPRPCRKLLTGALFGILLLTRYDVFAVVALVYAIDRLVIRRLHAVVDGLFVMVGLLPFAACLAAYNAGVTGNPFQLTSTWATPGIVGLPDEGVGVGLLLMRPALFNLVWLGSLAQFGGLPVMVLAAIALATKIRRRTCRFYDFLFPAAVVFYSFVPFTGDHQYGPRYWFWAWPLSMLTITTGLVDQVGRVRIAGRRVAFEGFAAACLIYAAGAFCVLLITTHAYIAARRAIYDVPQPESRAIVLLPNRSLTVWPWQGRKIDAPNLDFTRNGIDYNAKVLYGRDNSPDAVSRACQLDDREVFRWEEPGRLVRVACR
ncbi:MAG: hypothetical protein P4L90_07295 [Rhodopila sp.]|nr:hypothetical protein [Rhodopila sp.]